MAVGAYTVGLACVAKPLAIEIQITTNSILRTRLAGPVVFICSRATFACCSSIFRHCVFRTDVTRGIAHGDLVLATVTPLAIRCYLNVPYLWLPSDIAYTLAHVCRANVESRGTPNTVWTLLVSTEGFEYAHRAFFTYTSIHQGESCITITVVEVLAVRTSMNHLDNADKWSCLVRSDTGPLHKKYTPMRSRLWKTSRDDTLCIGRYAL